MYLTKSLCLYVLIVFGSVARAQYKIEVLDTNTFSRGEGVVLSKTGFRGISVVDDQVVWVSGSRGTIARSTDGGKTFSYVQITGYEKSDFRDIEAFDDSRAIIMSSGTPALILKTVNGGQTWKEVFRRNDSAYFLDAMDFWDEQRGALVGDPINGHFVILETKDAGETWQEIDTTRTPGAMAGEAVFAASGTSLRCIPGDCCSLAFVTGGALSRLTGVNLERKYIHWESFKISIVQGQSSQGAFSFASNDSALVVVGGDYLSDTARSPRSCIQYTPAKTDEWSKMENDVNGYRSCVEAINGAVFIACGTSGVDVYRNRRWSLVSAESFNVVRKAKKGKVVFLAGQKGKIGRLIY